MLKITGSIQGEEETKIEFITAGTMKSRGNISFISYEESEISGMEGVVTSLTISADKVKMKRLGRGLDETVMEFEKGKRHNGLYATPYGNIGMELLTNDIKNVRKDDEISKLSIDYDLSLKGIAESRNILEIEILGGTQ